MKFWDASAIVPLVVKEPTTTTLQALGEEDPTMAFDRLKHLAQAWHEVDPSDPIREAAVRFRRVHLSEWGERVPITDLR